MQPPKRFEVKPVMKPPSKTAVASVGPATPETAQDNALRSLLEALTEEPQVNPGDKPDLLSRVKAEQKRFAEATDSEFWFAVHFESREQKHEFLAKLGALHLGTKYLKGRDLAAVLGIELEPTAAGTRQLKQPSKRLLELTRK